MFFRINRNVTMIFSGRRGNNGADSGGDAVNAVPAVSHSLTGKPVVPPAAGVDVSHKIGSIEGSNAGSTSGKSTPVKKAVVVSSTQIPAPLKTTTTNTQPTALNKWQNGLTAGNPQGARSRSSSCWW
jgi:hypothetical protein